MSDRSSKLWYTSDVVQPHEDILLDKLLDVNKKRIGDMDAAGVSMQVLSLSAPGCEQFNNLTGTAIAKRVNDELSKIVEKHPDEFVGLASLAPQNPEEAADELERSVKELGFRGCKIHSNIGGSYLDDEKYWVILKKAEDLDVPIFLHPTVPSITELRTYGFALAGPLLGFGIETAMGIVRLILSGIFDKYPRLKFVLGHLGETVPFLLNRIDFGYNMALSEVKIKLANKPSYYFRNNVFVGTSGDFEKPVLTSTYQIMGVEKMLFATDYPYEDPKQSTERVATIFSESDEKKICHLNAQNLLHLNA